jgi:carboxyl-terminal processing protease
MAATEEKQVPWDSSSLTAPFFFTPGSAKPAAAQPAPSASSFAAEKAVWEAISDSKQPSDYKAYLSQYPHGTYAGLARSRLASLGSNAGSAQPQQPKVAPAAATIPAPAPEPEPVATDASVRSEPEESDEPPTGKKVELDSRGVDCRIMDATRPAADCKNTKRFAPANKPNRH